MVPLPLWSKGTAFMLCFHCLSCLRHCISVVPLPLWSKGTAFMLCFHCISCLRHCLSVVSTAFLVQDSAFLLCSLPFLSKTLPFCCVSAALLV